MKTISYTSLRQNLSSILDEIENDQEAFYVTRKKHQDIVMVAKNDYESLIETLHLLSNPKNVIRLNESLLQDKEKKYKKVNLD